LEVLVANPPPLPAGAMESTRGRLNEPEPITVKGIEK